MLKVLRGSRRKACFPLFKRSHSLQKGAPLKGSLLGLGLCLLFGKLLLKELFGLLLNGLDELLFFKDLVVDCRISFCLEHFLVLLNVFVHYLVKGLKHLDGTGFRAFKSHVLPGA